MHGKYTDKVALLFYFWNVLRKETNREMEISDSNLAGDSGEAINNRENQDERESTMNHCMISV